MYLWWKIWLAETELYDIYVCIYRITNGRLEVRILFTVGWSNTHCVYFTELSFEASRAPVICLYLHFTITHWRILMPCRRPRFTELLTISDVTLIIIHKRKIPLWRSFESKRVHYNNNKQLFFHRKTVVCRTLYKSHAI